MMSKLSTTSTASKTEAEAEAASPISIKKEIIGKLKAAIEQGQQSKAESVQHEAELIYKLATTKTKTQGRKLKTKGLLDMDIILNPNPNVVCSLTVPSTMPSTSITSTTTTTLDCERPVSPTACGHMNENYGPELMFSHTFTKLYDSPYNNNNPNSNSSKNKNNKLGIVKVGQGGTQIQQWLNNDVKKKKKDKDKKKKRKKKKNRILDDGVTAIKK